MNSHTFVRAPGFLMAALLVGAPAIAGGIACGRCPHCEHRACAPTPTTIVEKKHCWEVECKDICVPKFKWPWEKCDSPPPCGRVKTVKELKKVEYECEKCGYKWEAPPRNCKVDK